MATLVAIASRAWSQEVVYDFLPTSMLTHHSEDDSGIRQLIQVEIKGTFSAVLLQSKEGAALQIQNVNFESVSGPEYRVTGRGAYFLYYPFPDRIPSSGLPGLQYAELILNINHLNNVFFSIPELQIGRTFPQFGIGLVSFRAADDPTRDSFGLRFHAAPRSEEAVRFFRRGDANADGETDISDSIFVLGVLFLGEKTPTCLDAADSNDDGYIDVSDAVFLLGTLFQGQGKVPVPSPLCGLDPTGDGLDCMGQEPCMEMRPTEG